MIKYYEELPADIEDTYKYILDAIKESRNISIVDCNTNINRNTGDTKNTIKVFTMNKHGELMQIHGMLIALFNLQKEITNNNTLTLYNDDLARLQVILNKLFPDVNILSY